MWNYDEDEAAAEPAADRAFIGTIYLILCGILFSGVVHLVASWR